MKCVSVVLCRLPLRNFLVQFTNKMLPNLGNQQQNQLPNKSQSDPQQVDSFHSPCDESNSYESKPFAEGSQKGNMHIG